MVTEEDPELSSSMELTKLPLFVEQSPKEELGMAPTAPEQPKIEQQKRTAARQTW